QGPRDAAYVMPHLVGFTEADAGKRLDAAGLKKKVNYVTAPQWPHGSVIDQAPLGGARVGASAPVELTVAN
ncbi:MAG: PASTA domain-containing protein, partial [Acidobacteria bacterium]|nr:PASTA domain-containing protein [Acidobacteriota bacterium]